MSSRPRLGNRVWRVETTSGPRALKYYARRRGRLATAVRAALAKLYGKKSSPSARGRRATELQLLRHWRAEGFAVPKAWEQLPGATPDPRFTAIDWIEGPSLEQLLFDGSADREQRRGWMRALGEQSARRHQRALATQDPSLIQEHACLSHVLLQGERLVHFDLEQAFLPGQAVLPLVAKELGSLLRRLARKVSPEVFEQDIAAFVTGYADPALLLQVVEETRHSRSALRRLIWTLDRRRCARGRSPHKFDVYDALARHARDADPEGSSHDVAAA